MSRWAKREEAASTRRKSWAIGVGLMSWTILGIGPCGPIPGGSLPNGEASGVVQDWSFVNEAKRCAVEVRPADPHSVTVNCMSWQGRLFVSCSKCEGKDWSGYALAEPSARIEIGNRVYPAQIARITEPDELDEIWRARAEKLGNDPEPRAEGWWTFELRSR